CVHTATSCDDGNACTTDSCDAATGCAHVAISCDDGNACTNDACDAATGCVHTAVACDVCAPSVGCLAPALSISVTVSTNGTCPGQEVVNVEAGTSVTWCYVVTNTGDTPVSSIVVTDNQYGVVPGAPFALNPGQSHTLSLNVSANVDVTLTASAA